MPGLIDEGGTTGLCYTTLTGLDWLEGGVGGPSGLIILDAGPVATEMITEAGLFMVTENDDFMVTQ